MEKTGLRQVLRSWRWLVLPWLILVYTWAVGTWDIVEVARRLWSGPVYTQVYTDAHQKIGTWSTADMTHPIGSSPGYCCCMASCMVSACCAHRVAAGRSRMPRPRGSWC